MVCPTLTIQLALLLIPPPFLRHPLLAAAILEYLHTIFWLPSSDTSLALTYHPDRNPGREKEVLAEFQRIQSAHEVLTDPKERAMYDKNRIIKSQKSGYQGASGVRGNPWSDAGSQWAPPPRRPGAAGARRAPPRAPPPSAGAARYGKFEIPQQPPKPTPEGPDARRKVYEAWEDMKKSTASDRSNRPPPPARDYTVPSGRDESNSYKHSPPKKQPGFDDFRTKYSPDVSPHKRAQSTGAANRRGFTPATPGGGDEPAAPKAAYFTQPKPQVAPEPPSRAPPASANNVQPDPLRQFRQQVDPTFETTRKSTPYQTHGGERLNPFESANINRSASTRERSDRPENSARVPRTGSDPNLGQAQPQRSCSFADRPFKPSAPKYAEEAVNSSSSDDGPELPLYSRRFAKLRSTAAGMSKNGQRMSEAAARPEHYRTPSVSDFQKWYRDNPGAEPPFSGSSSDKPRTGFGQANPQPTGENVYGTPHSHSNPSNPLSGRVNSHPLSTGPAHATAGGSKGRDAGAFNAPRSKPNHAGGDTARNKTTKSRKRCSPIPEEMSPKRNNSTPGGLDPTKFPFDRFDMDPAVFPKAGGKAVKLPSGNTADTLNPFEASQRHLVDELIKIRQANDANLNIKGTTGTSKGMPTASAHMQDPKPNRVNDDVLKKNHRHVQMHAAMGIPPKKQKVQAPQGHDRAQHLPGHNRQYATQANANVDHTRFSFNVDDSTFSSTSARPNGFTTSSNENTNKKFTPEEWEGKFDAGQDYFRPNQNAAGGPPRGRAQSGTRPRGRSPIKVRPVDPKATQPTVALETPIESPGGTRFAPEEWAQSFKPQTFMPPPPVPSPTMSPRSTSARKGRVPSIRRTMGGGAAIVDDSDNTSDDKPLFTGRRKSQPTPIVTSSPSPDPMEVDTPPVAPKEPQSATANTVPGLSHEKRAAKTPESPTDSALKVEFGDLKLRDLLSHLNLPNAPVPPKIPVSPTPEYTRPPKPAYHAYIQEFKAYMCDWDLYINQFMFHMLARKKQNDESGTMRWEDDGELEKYRLALKEDSAVLAHWQATQEYHQAVMKHYAVLKETMKDRIERERPRKKTS